jgi:hypothetical protein
MIEYNGQTIRFTHYRIRGDWAIISFGSYQIRIPKEVIDGSHNG